MRLLRISTHRDGAQAGEAADAALAAGGDGRPHLPLPRQLHQLQLQEGQGFRQLSLTMRWRSGSNSYNLMSCSPSSSSSSSCRRQVTSALASCPCGAVISLILCCLRSAQHVVSLQLDATMTTGGRLCSQVEGGPSCGGGCLLTTRCTARATRRAQCALLSTAQSGSDQGYSPGYQGACCCRR